MLSFRPARPDDVDRLTDVAVRSKQYWGYSEAQIEAWRNGLTFTADDLSEMTVIAGEVEDRIIAVYALDDMPETGAEWVDIDGFWLDPDYIGQGYGRQMFEHLVGQARRAGKRIIRILADPNARAFYERQGAVLNGEDRDQDSGRLLPELYYTID